MVTHDERDPDAQSCATERLFGTSFRERERQPPNVKDPALFSQGKAAAWFSTPALRAIRLAVNLKEDLQLYGRPYPKPALAQAFLAHFEGRFDVQVKAGLPWAVAVRGLLPGGKKTLILLPVEETADQRAESIVQLGARSLFLPPLPKGEEKKADPERFHAKEEEHDRFSAVFALIWFTDPDHYPRE